MPDDAIAESLAVAAAQGDPAPDVYARLFAAHPQMEALFVRDTTGNVRGHMLATAIDNILGVAADDALAALLIQSERVNHENLGVPPEVFPAFFAAIAGTLRDRLGAGWTAEMDAGWAALLARLSAAAQ